MSVTVLEFASSDELSAAFGKKSGISSLVMTRGSLAFLNEFGTWLRRYAAPTRRIPVIPPNPAHATTFWTPIEDIKAASKWKMPLDQLLEVASEFHIEEELFTRPVYTLSSGEKALVALAKCFLMLPDSDGGVICDPSAWLHATRRSLVMKTINASPHSPAMTWLLKMREEELNVDPSMQRRGPTGWATTALPWVLDIDDAEISFQARKFPTNSTASSINYQTNGLIELDSPTLMTGDNGVGKTSLARALARNLPLSKGRANMVVNRLTCRPRLVLHDAAIQLLGMDPLGHEDWTFQYSARLKSLSHELFERMQNRVRESDWLDSEHHSIGNLDTPNSMLQAKIMLVAERLAANCQAILLDEPTWGLGDRLAFAFLEAVIAECHARGVVVLIISHHLRLPQAMFKSRLNLKIDQERNVVIEKVHFVGHPKD